MLTINPTPLARENLIPGASAPTTQVLSASNNGVATILIAPKAGNISKVGMNVTAKAGTPPTYRISVQGISGRQPDGTVLGSTTAKADTATFSTGWTWFALDTPITVTQGQKISLVVTYLSGTVDGSNNITVAVGCSSVTAVVATPYAVTEVAGTWGLVSVNPSMSAQYDDGSVTVGTWAYSTNVNNAWNSGTTASLYRGTKWVPQTDVRLIGGIVIARPVAAADFNLALFLGANVVNQTQAVVINTDWRAVSASLAGYVPLTPTVITAGTVVRLCVQPTTVTNWTAFCSSTMADLASRQAYWGDLSGTQGTSASPPVWTDAANDIYGVIPVIDQVGQGGCFQSIESAVRSPLQLQAF